MLSHATVPLKKVIDKATHVFHQYTSMLTVNYHSSLAMHLISFPLAFSIEARRLFLFYAKTFFHAIDKEAIVFDTFCWNLKYAFAMHFARFPIAKVIGSVRVHPISSPVLH